MKKLLTLIWALTIGTTAMMRAQISETESNDLLTTANDLPLNTTLEGQTCTYDNPDWYRVILPEDGFLKISTLTAGEGVNPNAPYIFTLFSPTGNPWNSFSPTTGNNGVMIADTSGWCCLKADTYYIKVQRDYAFAYCYDYTFSLELIPPVFQNDVEPNSMITDELVTIGFNTQAEGHVSFINDPQNSGTDSYDYFKIVPPINGMLRMFIESEAQSTGSNDLKIKLHNEDGSVWYQQSTPIGDFQSPNSDTLYWDCTPNDTLIVLFFTDNFYDRGYSYRMRYDMVSPFFENDIEPNNSSATAQIIDIATPVMGNQYYYGDGSEDIFKFAKPDTGFFKVRVTSSTNSSDGNLGTKVQLLDNNYSYIAQLNAPLGIIGELAIDSLTIAYLAADTFYIKVFSDYAYAACRSYLLEFFYYDPGIGLDEFALGNFQIFPNPANDKLTIDTRQLSGEGTVQIMNIFGEVVWVKNLIFGGQIQIDASEFAGCIYFVKTTSGNRSGVRKVMME